MNVLKIWKDGVCQDICFDAPMSLKSILTEHSFSTEHPCSGKGRCGKCGVVLQGQVSPPNEAEKKAGTRLSCQTLLLGDAQVWLASPARPQIEAFCPPVIPKHPVAKGIGAAIDIGTTTLVLKLYSLHTGAELASAAAMNPQRSIAADVMGRIQAALDGNAMLLQRQIQDAVSQLLAQVCASASITPEDISYMIMTGNTTMLYLLTGRDPECLSRAPFEADMLFGERGTFHEIPVYYPPCISAFVGADITCSILASGMDQLDSTALLCDIGTNGEIALWKDGRLHVTSTAAGPAFEGADISCGCGSVPGAIDQVWIHDKSLCIHTITDAPAVGLCGSGLIDAIAVFLETEDIDETGATERNFLSLQGNVGLVPRDIRAVQLAKAAIAAGFQTLLENAEIAPEDVTRLYIAGGFGSHLNIDSAFAIGLIPSAFRDKVTVLGNAALTGAAQILMDTTLQDRAQQLAQNAIHLNLGGNPKFNAHYIEQLLF